MAYARQADPILQSLSEVGQNIRGLSGDILTRRRLDLTEGQQIAEAERERNLQSLRTQALQQEGQVKVLETTGKLSQIGQQMELAQKQDVRAGESHVLQQRTGEFQLQRGQELLPFEKSQAQASINASNAAAGASRASAGASAARTRQAEFELQQMKEQQQVLNTPLSDAQVAAGIVSTIGPPGLDFYTKAMPPGSVKTLGELLTVGTALAKYSPDDVRKRLVDDITQKMMELPEGSPERAEYANQRELMLQNQGKVAGQNVKTSEIITQEIAQNTIALDTAFDRDDPLVIAREYAKYKQLKKVEPTIRDPADAMQAQSMRIPKVVEQFTQIAEAQIREEGRKQGATEDEMLAKIPVRIDRLIETYKHPKYFHAHVADEDAKRKAGKTPPSSSPSAATPAADTPVTPQLQRIREVQEQQRAREAQVQGKQTETESREHFKRLTTGQNLELSGMAGLIKNADDLRAAEDLYVQIRRQSPTLGAGQAMQQLRQQLSQGR